MTSFSRSYQTDYLPSVLVSLAIVVIGLASFWKATDGGEAWTAETARRVEISNNPKELPEFQVKTVHSDVCLLNGFQKPIPVFNFIYTNCQTVCNALGAQFNALQNLVVSKGFQSEVHLLSITFDNANDDIGKLGAYLDRFEAGEGWDAIRIADEQELKQLLNMLGVIVIPEETVGFIHNAATYIAYEGAVIEILDMKDQHRLVELITGLSQTQ